VFRAYYGLSGFPLELVGADPSALVGGLVDGRGRRLSRTVVSQRLKDCRIEVVAQLPSDLRGDLSPTAEQDPAHSAALDARTREIGLSDYEVVKLRQVALLAALDWTHQAPARTQIHSALLRWAHQNNLEVSVAESVPVIEQEHRNAANAALSVALWRILSDGDLLDRCLGASESMVWLELPLLDHDVPRPLESDHDHMVVDDPDTNQLMWLAFEVNKQRDPDGSKANVAIDALISGRINVELSLSKQMSLVNMLGGGVAAADSWRIIELARWHVQHHGVTWVGINLVVWSAHVASRHDHDALAWRLTVLAERWANELAGEDPEAAQVKLSFVELIRAGCRIREAEQLVETPAKAGARVVEARSHLERARHAMNLGAPDGTDRARIPLVLRHLEILVVAARLDSDGHSLEGFPSGPKAISGLERSIQQAHELVAGIAGDSERHDSIFAARLEGIDRAFAELSDRIPAVSGRISTGALQRA